MLIFAVISLLLVCGAVAALIWFLRWLRKQNPSLAQTAQTDGEASVQEFLGIKSFDRGIVNLTGGRYRVYIEAPSLNVPLMAEEEQVMLETRYASLLKKLNFPVQFYTQTRPLDMQDVMAELSDYNEAPEILQDYAAEMQDYLLNLTSVHPIWVRRKLIVVPYDNPNATMDEVIKELDNRATMILAELDAAGIEGHCLTTEEIAHVFYSQFNKNRVLSMPFRNIIDGGHTQTIVGGGDLEDYRLFQ